MVSPPRAIGALIFVPCECSAGCQRLAETGETDQKLFLSTREQAGMVAGWPGCFFGLTLMAHCLPDLGCFVAYPSWLKRAQMFRTCKWSPACQRGTGTLKLVLAMFSSAWELAAKAAEGPGCFQA